MPPKYNGAWIYGIYNETKGKWYIGSSVNVRKRICEHTSYFRSGKGAQKLQADYDSGDEFIVFVLAEVSGDAPVSKLKAWVIFLCGGFRFPAISRPCKCCGRSGAEYWQTV